MADEPALPALPLAGTPGRRPRKDAERNREQLLCVAAQLVDDCGAEGIDVRDVARAAGVGVGTVYRRFGDKAGLLAAILDEDERALQDAVLHGPPPLGPGAPPDERVLAFLDRLATFTEEHLDLLLHLQASGAGVRFRVGSHAAWRLHLAVLLRAALPDAGDEEPEALAELLLAPLAAEIVHHQVHVLTMGCEPRRHALLGAARAILSGYRP